jgi:hypothetical protein
MGSPVKSKDSPKTTVGRQMQVQFAEDPRETGICNAYHIDRTSLSGYFICTFGTVVLEEVVSRWAFGMEERLVKTLRDNLLGYVRDIRAQVSIEPFKHPKALIAKPFLSPHPTDWLGAARNENTAEFVFYTWSWHAAGYPSQYRSEKSDKRKAPSGPSVNIEPSGCLDF